MAVELSLREFIRDQVATDEEYADLECLKHEPQQIAGPTDPYRLHNWQPNPAWQRLLGLQAMLVERMQPLLGLSGQWVGLGKVNGFGEYRPIHHRDWPIARYDHKRQIISASGSNYHPVYFEQRLSAADNHKDSSLVVSHHQKASVRAAVEGAIDRLAETHSSPITLEKATALITEDIGADYSRTELTPNLIKEVWKSHAPEHLKLKPGRPKK